MLIQKDSQGNWCLKGVPWHMLRSGSILDDKTWERLYGAGKEEYEANFRPVLWK